MLTLNTPLLLLQDAAAGSPVSDSAAVVSATLGGGSDVAVMITLAVILVGGVAVLVAGDRVKRSESHGRLRGPDMGDGLAR